MNTSFKEAKDSIVEIITEGPTLQGILNIPQKPRGVVLFAHGSGSSRLSPRNTFVARTLQKGGLATLLVDLLEAAESQDRRKVFDIELLADRLFALSDWLTKVPELHRLRIGYFGASTGAGAALQAAAQSPAMVQAVVSRGGRPDLAEGFLYQVMAPTLLIVGGLDSQVLRLNEEAMTLLTCPKQLSIVPGATHLFEEPGTLEQVADLACEWFQQHLAV